MADTTQDQTVQDQSVQAPDETIRADIERLVDIADRQGRANITRGEAAAVGRVQSWLGGHYAPEGEDGEMSDQRNPDATTTAQGDGEQEGVNENEQGAQIQEGERDTAPAPAPEEGHPNADGTAPGEDTTGTEQEIDSGEPFAAMDTAEDTPEEGTQEGTQDGAPDEEGDLVDLLGETGETLLEGGFENLNQVRAATDEELLAVKGIGKVRLAEIREATAE